MDINQELYFYVHQEPIYNDFVADFRPPLNISIVLYSINSESHMKYREHTPFSKDQLVGREFKLTHGSYVFVVVTSTPKLVCHPELAGRNLDIMFSNGQFSLKMLDLIEDLFERLDDDNKNYLDLENLLPVFEVYGKVFNKSEFKEEFLPKYKLNGERITIHGFTAFFYDLYEAIGEEKFRRMLMKLGYNNCLHCESCRNFMVSIHTYLNNLPNRTDKLKARIRDSIIEGLYLRAIIDITTKDGEIIQTFFNEDGGAELIHMAKNNDSIHSFVGVNKTQSSILIICNLSMVLAANYSRQIIQMVSLQTITIGTKTWREETYYYS